MPQDQIFSISQRARNRSLPLYSLHLDLIRGLAALLVVVGHLRVAMTGHSGDVQQGQATGLLTHPAHATGLGHAAVVVFFVLSGYLVGGTVVRDLQRQRFSWHEYALKRIVRLWTVLLPTLLLGTLLDFLSASFFRNTGVIVRSQFGREVMNGHGPLLFLRYASFSQSIERLHTPEFGSNAALWSLSNEFFYYVLFPLIAIACIGKQFSAFKRIAVALPALFLLWFLGPSITNYFPLWLCGVAAYVAPAKIPARFQRVIIPALVVQCLAVLFYVRSHAFDALQADTLIAISYTALLYGLLHQVASASPGIYARLAHALSLPSYSLYANHIPACILVAAIFEAEFPGVFRHIGFASTIVFSVVLAYNGLFYYVFERKTDRIRSFVRSRLPALKPAPAAA